MTNTVFIPSIMSKLIFFNDNQGLNENKKYPLSDESFMDYSNVFDPKRTVKYLVIDLIEKHTTIHFLSFIKKSFDNIVLNIGYHAFPTTILKDTYSDGNPLKIKNFSSAYVILGLLGFSIIYKV